MSQLAARGIALEFGKSPHLRPFNEPAEARPPTDRCTLFLISVSPGSGKTLALLRACESLQGMVKERKRSPDWLITTTEYRRVSAVTEQLLKSPSENARAFEKMVFYCFKALDHWSVSEKSEFETELESAIDFLSQLAPAESLEQDPPADADSERRLQLARERRDQLLREEKWIDAPAVHIQQGGNPSSQGVNNTASRLRRSGELLGAWNGREFLHPTFQFRPDTGRLMPEMKTLLDFLPKDRSGWRQALWLFQRHGQLDGARPADVFQKNPQAVIKAARSDFELNDERW
jgi:hypothetical protein